MNTQKNVNGSVPVQEPQTPMLFHDGCSDCLDIARTLLSAMPSLEVVDLNLCPERTEEAAAKGIVALPCLVLGKKLMPVAPHSQLADIGSDGH